MPRGTRSVFTPAFWAKRRNSLYISREKGHHYYFQTEEEEEEEYFIYPRLSHHAYL